MVYDPNYGEEGLMVLPSEMEGCVVENVSVNGVVYEEAVYDAEFGKHYTDEAGVFHFDGCLKDHKWIWGEHLKEIFEHFEREAARRAFLAEMTPVSMTIPPEYYNCCDEWDREVFCASDTFPEEGLIKYPRMLQVKKYPNDSYIVEEICPCKYPNIHEALDCAVKDGMTIALPHSA